MIASDAQRSDEQHMQEKVKHIKYGEMLDNVR